MNTRGWCARGVNRALGKAGLYVSPLPSAYMYEAARGRQALPRDQERERRAAQEAAARRGGGVRPYNSPGNPHGHIYVTLPGGREASDHIQLRSTRGTQHAEALRAAGAKLDASHACP